MDLLKNFSDWLRNFWSRKRRPLPGIFRVKEEELGNVVCQRCHNSMGQIAVVNTGGGPYIICPQCQSKHYLMGR